MSLLLTLIMLTITILTLVIYDVRMWVHNPLKLYKTHIYNQFKIKLNKNSFIVTNFPPNIHIRQLVEPVARASSLIITKRIVFITNTKPVYTLIHSVTWRCIQCFSKLQAPTKNFAVMILIVAYLLHGILHRLYSSHFFLYYTHTLNTNCIYSIVVVLETVEVDSCQVFIYIIIIKHPTL